MIDITNPRVEDERARGANALEVLAFIDGYNAMPSQLWRARWPEWSQKVSSASERYRRETRPGHTTASSDATVNSINDAVIKWALLPLIREALHTTTGGWHG